MKRMTTRGQTTFNANPVWPEGQRQSSYKTVERIRGRSGRGCLVSSAYDRATLPFQYGSPLEAAGAQTAEAASTADAEATAIGVDEGAERTEPFEFTDT